MFANMCNQSRRADWITREIAVYDNCSFVHVFLSWESQFNSGLPNQVSRCTSQWNEVEFTRFREDDLDNSESGSLNKKTEN